MKDLELIESIKREQIIEQINEEYSRQYIEDRNTRRRELRESFNATLGNIRGRYPNVELLDRMTYVCPDRACDAVSPSLNKYFFDYGHHTLEGARAYGEVLHTTEFGKKLLNAIAGKKMSRQEI